MAAANRLIPSQIGDLDDLTGDFELLLREGGDGSFRSYGENPNVTCPAFSMEDWIVDCSPQEGKSAKESRALFPLFEFQSNFQTLKGWSDDGCNAFFGFGRNDAGIKNKSFTDILQPCFVGHHFPLSHLQSSSNALNGSRSEASSTALQSVTGSELAAVNGNDLFECSTIGKPSLLMNGHINQGEYLSRNQNYLYKKYLDFSYFNGGQYGNFASSPRVKYPVSPLSSRGQFMSRQNSRKFEISDIIGHVVEFCMDHSGSRFLQNKLKTAPCEDKNLIFPEIFSHARTLMADVYGNYVIQKFLEHGNDIQRKQLASQISGHVLSFSLQVYGCRVIQKVLEVVDVDGRVELVSELNGSIIRCACNQNGNHVIQKCIECIPHDRIRFITDALRGHVLNLSLDPYGCRVIQRVLVRCTDASTSRYVMDEILNSLASLVRDQFGNYVVQHVLLHGNKSQRSAIVGQLLGKIVLLSQQKFSSNVVEKCLTFCTPEEHRLMVNEMLESANGNEPPLLVHIDSEIVDHDFCITLTFVDYLVQGMMKDQYGNYVVQKALETCDQKDREIILSRIKAHMSFSMRSKYAKHVSARVDKVIAAGERLMRMPSY